MVMGERVDYWLFGVWPYVAATSVLIGPIVRALAAWRSHADLQREFTASLECLWGDPCWRGGVASVLVGHLLILLYPAAVLAWNRSPIRLLALEGALLAASLLAIGGLTAVLLHNIHRWRARPRAPHAESAVIALAMLVLTSGLLLAIVERWASSWAALTWPPYVTSVVGLNPDVAIVAQMPYLVRLHVASALALITVLPFTPAIALVFYPLSRVVVRGSVRSGFTH
jgi:nitrate reductase gamma subunit